MEKKKTYIPFSRKLLKTLLIVIGTISVFLGILGVFLPLLPTTPFLLLAAFCYAKSSERFYNWLISNRLCGEYIRNYKEGLGIKQNHKVFTILLLWFTIGYSVLFITTNTWVKLILVLIAISVTIHLIRLKTYRSPDRKKKQR